MATVRYAYSTVYCCLNYGCPFSYNETGMITPVIIASGIKNGGRTRVQRHNCFYCKKEPFVYCSVCKKFERKHGRKQECHLCKTCNKAQFHNTHLKNPLMFCGVHNYEPINHAPRFGVPPSKQVEQQSINNAKLKLETFLTDQKPDGDLSKDWHRVMYKDMYDAIIPNGTSIKLPSVSELFEHPIYVDYIKLAPLINCAQ